MSAIAEKIESIKTANMNRKHNNLVTKLSKKNPTYLHADGTIFVVLNRHK